MIYLDNGATTPIDSDVLEKMLPYLTENYGNPSSQHLLGRRGGDGILFARDKIANILGCKSEELFFTSGGTECANFALKGACAALKDKGKHIVVSAIEHPAVIESAKDMQNFGYCVTFVKPDKNGVIQVEDIKKAVRKDTIFCAVMHANNETGVIQPIEEIGSFLKEKNVFFYTDCVQTACLLSLPVKHCSSLGISSHKFYGPKGFGVLYLKNTEKIARLISGGMQERGLRGGTQNVAFAVACAYALEKAVKEREENLKKFVALKNAFIDGITSNVEGVSINGGGEVLPSHVNLSFANCDGANLVFLLDLKGIAVSTGSACTAGATTLSHVLTAMSLPESQVKGAVRFTFGKYNTLEEVKEVVSILKSCVSQIRNS